MVLPSIGLTVSHKSHLLLHAVVQVLVNKAVLPDSQIYTSKKNIPTISAISTATEQRLINLKIHYEYYMIGQRKYEMTKIGENDFEWEEGRKLIRVGIEVRERENIKFKM